MRRLFDQRMCVDLPIQERENLRKLRYIEKTLTTIEKNDDTLGKREPMKLRFQNFT